MTTAMDSMSYWQNTSWSPWDEMKHGEYAGMSKLITAPAQSLKADASSPVHKLTSCKLEKGQSTKTVGRLGFTQQHLELGSALAAEFCVAAEDTLVLTPPGDVPPSPDDEPLPSVEDVTSRRRRAPATASPTGRAEAPTASRSQLNHRMVERMCRFRCHAVMGDKDAPLAAAGGGVANLPRCGACGTKT